MPDANLDDKFESENWQADANRVVKRWLIFTVPLLAFCFP
jgi:hypothetical protein